MSVRFITITLNADRSWTFTWPAGSGGPYRVVLRGKLLATVTVPAYNHRPDGIEQDAPPLEVSEGNAADSELYPPRFTVQWYGDSDVTRYVVQMNAGSGWQGVKSVIESGLWVYTYVSDLLTAGTPYQFRVVSVGNEEFSGTPAVFARTLACHPEPPRVTASYNKPYVSIGGV